MLCCLLFALILGPVWAWAFPRVMAGADCCSGRQRTVAIVAAAGVTGVVLCLSAWLIWGHAPAAFHHICSFWPGR